MATVSGGVLKGDGKLHMLPWKILGCRYSNTALPCPVRNWLCPTRVASQVLPLSYLFNRQEAMVEKITDAANPKLFLENLTPPTPSSFPWWILHKFRYL